MSRWLAAVVSAPSVLVACALPGLALERRLIGPEGGSVTAVALHPATPAIVYAGTGAGVFKSLDRGATWSPVSHGLGDAAVSALAVDPRDGDVVFAATLRGVWKTSDGGAHWSQAGAGGPAGALVTALALDASNPETLYAGIAPRSFAEKVTLFRSADGGASWSPLALSSEPEAQPAILAVAASGPVVFAGTNTTLGLLRSLDGGSSWQRAASVSGGVRVVLLRRKQVWVGTSQGVFRSFDGGASFVRASTGLGDIDVKALAFDTTDPRLVLAGGTGGVYKSSDRGNHWQPASRGLGARDVLSLAADASLLLAGTVFDGLFTRSDHGGIWRPSSRGLRAAGVLAVAVAADGTLHAITPGGLSTSADRGETWRLLSTERSVPLAVDPRDHRTLYARRRSAETGPGPLLRSRDGGATWKRFDPTSEGAQLVAIDPSQGNHILLAEVSFLRTSVVWRTDDGGRRWSSAGLTCVFPTALAVAPGGREAYLGGNPQCAAGTLGGGLSRSLDGGSTWTEVGLAPDFPRFVKAVAIDLRRPARLAVSAEGFVVVDGVVTMARGIYRSLDRGTTWGRSAAPGSGPVRALLFRSGPPATLVAGADGLFLSPDGGATWTLADDLDGQSVNALMADPLAADTFYAATSGGLFAFSER